VYAIGGTFAIGGSSVARNSMGGLVMVESILLKRLSIRAQGWWNGDAKTIPAVCMRSCAVLPRTEWHKYWDVPSVPLCLQA